MAELDQDQLFDPPIGERLRVAREEKGIALEEVARLTRIPIRHLEHIERGDWEALPAITYSVGFVRAYANAVGLDGPALGAELRQQLGATRSVGAVSTAYYEPTDPARVPPRSLAILAALIALLIVAGYLVWRNHAVGNSAGSGDAVALVPDAPAPSASSAPARTAPPPAAAAANGPVVIAAAEPVWLRIYEAGGAKLYEGTLKAGDRYQVPATAVAPEILTGRPNVLRITVGASAIPPLGPPERRVRDVSLKPADLLARLRATAPVAAASPAAAPPQNPSAQ